MIANHELTFVRILEGENRKAVIDPQFFNLCVPGSLFVVAVDKPFDVMLSEDQTVVWGTTTTKALLVTVAGVKRSGGFTSLPPLRLPSLEGREG